MDGLVERWMEAVKPFDLEQIKGKYLEAFSKRTDLPDEVRQDVIKAIDKIDIKKLNERIKLFAREHFSEEVLLTAVLFFESETGKQYLVQRDRVNDYFQVAFGNALGDATNEVMGS